MLTAHLPASRLTKCKTCAEVCHQRKPFGVCRVCDRTIHECMHQCRSSLVASQHSMNKHATRQSSTLDTRRHRHDCLQQRTFALRAASSTPQSYCPFCKRAKRALLSVGIKPLVLELDEREDGMALQQALLARTGQRTVPSVSAVACIACEFDHERRHKAAPQQAVIRCRQPHCPAPSSCDVVVRLKDADIHEVVMWSCG